MIFELLKSFSRKLQKHTFFLLESLSLSQGYIFVNLFLKERLEDVFPSHWFSLLTTSTIATDAAYWGWPLHTTKIHCHQIIHSFWGRLYSNFNMRVGQFLPLIPSLLPIVMVIRAKSNFAEGSLKYRKIVLIFCLPSRTPGRFSDSFYRFFVKKSKTKDNVRWCIHEHHKFWMAGP